MIELSGVQKTIDGRPVLDLPELAVTAGQVAAVVGAAGSGADALQDLLTGRSRPTTGAVHLAGADPIGDKIAFSSRVGVLFSDDALYSTRSARGNLLFHARLRGLPAAQVDAVLTAVGLADHADMTPAQLASGLNRRLAFAVASLHRPAVLLLTDPFARCDEATINLLSRQIRGHADGGGAVLILAPTDTYLAAICDTIHTLEQGRIVATREPAGDSGGGALPFKIPIKLEDRVALINPVDILYAAAEDGRTFLQFAGEKLPTQFTLNDLESRLGRSGFFRAHRGFLVNLQHVTEVITFTRSSYSLRLDDPAGTLIPLSREAARELRALLGY